jgi:dienelactone hydrolase
MSTTLEVSIPTSGGPLSGIVHLPPLPPAPVVVCCHGLMSSKESEKYVAIGREFSRNGLVVVRFDFSDSSESRAALEDSLIGSRVRDLNAVLDFVARQSWSNGRAGLLGSSLGGYLALLVAGSRHVDAVACWSTPFDLAKARPPEEDAQNLESQFPPGFRLGSPETLALLSAVPGVLVMHGQRDEVVPWSEAGEIYTRVGEPKRLMLMERADHRFLDPAVRKLAISYSLSWFREQGLAGVSPEETV